MKRYMMIVGFLLFYLSVAAMGEETKLWYSLSTYCIYSGYERHREAGIHGFCWELLKTGHNKQQIIPAAHQFSRYSNLKRTAKLVEEGILIDPMAYESAYRKCRDAADRLITFHEVFPL